ncbi:DUF885 family protein [Nocardiopsis suaedae]|uniref:DUF885 family protein n=1 Tax=Nocardiopsis suaedae TaxID=3018444 RepID=A0ABT4TVM0_9ACTN|nr:DUF885 family protein [Nocardiopsis suaedae]MDA2808265.1 DUF885 family protein [Nocardiopsis suaedae]
MTSDPDPGANAMTDRFRQVASRVLDALLEDAPDLAAALGDPRFAGRLVDPSEAAEAERVGLFSDALGALDEIDDTLIPPEDRVDLEMLRSHAGSELWRAAELRPSGRDPLALLPDAGFAALAGSGDPDLAAALAERCRALPDFLEAARERLTAGPGMPRPNAEEAAERARRTADLLRAAPVPEGAEPGAAEERAAAAEERAAAAEALRAHADWLPAAADPGADPCLGERSYAALLWYGLDAQIDPETLLTRAESDLLAAEEELAEAAAAIGGGGGGPDRVRLGLERLEREFAPLEGDAARQAVEFGRERARARACALGLPGAEDVPRADLERVLLDGAGRRAPELYLAAAREDAPGRAYLRARESEGAGAAAVRRALRSPVFDAGWAALAQALLDEGGWGLDDDRAEAAVRLVHRRERLRAAARAVVDVRAHARDMTEEEGRALLVERSRLTGPEAARCWRATLAEPTRGAVAYVGRRDVADLDRDVAVADPKASPADRAATLTSHGAPPPRLLRELLGLAPPM